GRGSRSASATWSRAIRRFPQQQSPHLIFWLQTAQSSASVLGIAEREISDSRGRGLPSLPPAPHLYANCSGVGPPYGRAPRHIYHGCNGVARSLSPAPARRLSQLRATSRTAPLSTLASPPKTSPRARRR